MYMGNNSAQVWVVSEQVGSTAPAERSLMEYFLVKKRDIPRRVGAVALLLGEKSEACGAFYCYLPIEETTKLSHEGAIRLPVQVKGQFFLGESRRMIELSGKNDFNSLWNKYFLENIIGPAYLRLIKHALENFYGDESSFEMEKFLSLFPSFRAGHSQVSEISATYYITKSLFSFLNNYPFVPVFSVNNEFIKYLPYSETHKVYDLEKVMGDRVNYLLSHFSVAFGLKFSLSKIPPNFYNLWNQCNVTLKQLSPESVLSRMTDKIKPPVLIKDTPLTSKENLLFFVL